MKKYALLVLLFCATVLLGAMMYRTAHQHTLTAASQEVPVEKTYESVVKEDVFSETTKEMAREGGKSAVRFLFSLIYK